MKLKTVEVVGLFDASTGSIAKKRK